MENFVDQAKKFMGTDEGKKLQANVEGNGQQGGSTDAFGNPGQPGQYAEKGQYGAVTGGGFGGGLAKDAEGKHLQGGNQQAGNQQGGNQGPSAYEGMDQGDSTATGGYGRNAAGSSFSRQNQMGAEDAYPEKFDKHDEDEGLGYKTGTSTPGYRQEGDVDAEAAENRMRNQNMNVYGQQADDRVKGNDYNEAI